MTVVDEIKARLSMLDIVEKDVTLKKSGRAYMGMCPFHENHNTPAFVVWPDTDTWRCFSTCNEGGDVFAYVMKRDGVDFKDALHVLADMAGVELNGYRPEQDAQQRETKAVFKAAADHYITLMSEPGPGRDYAHARGWTDDTIRDEWLGYYDGDAGALRAALQAAQVDVNAPAARALFKMPGQVLVYIHREISSVVYLSIRGIGEKAHWNPPADLVGERRVYYNSVYRQDARFVIVVEGQANAVTLAQWDFPAVALAGNSLSDDMATLLMQRHQVVYLGLDSDGPGFTALPKEANKAGPLVRVAGWPNVIGLWDNGLEREDKDSNDWLLAGGTPEECQTLLDMAPTWLDMLTYEATRDDIDEIGRDKAVKEVLIACTRLPEFELSYRRKSVADAIGLDLRSFDAMLKTTLKEMGLNEHGKPQYEIVGKQTYYTTRNQYGSENTSMLAHFAAEITADVTLDDGEEQFRQFEVKGECPAGIFNTIEIDVNEFAAMDWPLAKWGARAIITASKGSKEHLRVAILTLSKNIQIRRDYIHLGWRKLDGKMIYLSSQGAIGADGVNVKLVGDYVSRYSLPVTPENVKDAMQASLGFLDVGDRTMTVPLWAAMFYAPLCSILPPSFTLWLYGTTGTNKSTLTALAMCHFGEFSWNTPPAAWSFSASTMQWLSFILKDTPLWIDDFTSKTTSGGQSEITRKADELLRDWGNNTSKGRMQWRKNGLAPNRNYPPRGLIICPAEQMPMGHSIRARTFAVEARPGMVEVGEGSPLTLAQNNDAKLYPHAMAAYIMWLAGQYDELQKTIPGKIREYEDTIRGSQSHKRSPGNTAKLFLGFEMGVEFAVEVGAISRQDGDDLLSSGLATLIEIGSVQDFTTAEEDPVTLYMTAIQQMIDQGTCYLRNKDKPGEDGLIIPEMLRPRPSISYPSTMERVTLPQEGFLGWYDDQYYYLMADAAYNAVCQFYKRRSQLFPDSARGIKSKLKEKGISQPSAAGQRLEYQMGDGRRVLRLAR